MCATAILTISCKNAVFMRVCGYSRNENIPDRGKTELIRIENGDMTKINKEPPIIAVIVMPEAFLSNNRKSLTFYR